MCTSLNGVDKPWLLNLFLPLLPGHQYWSSIPCNCPGQDGTSHHCPESTWGRWSRTEVSDTISKRHLSSLSLFLPGVFHRASKWTNEILVSFLLWQIPWQKATQGRKAVLDFQFPVIVHYCGETKTRTWSIILMIKSRERIYSWSLPACYCLLCFRFYNPGCMKWCSSPSGWDVSLTQHWRQTSQAYLI